MNQALIILRGAPASGKTTIGQSLRNKEKKIVWLKIDNLKPFFSKDFGDSLDEVNKASLAILNSFLNDGYNVIFDGIFKNPDHALDAIKLAESKNIPVVVYQLSCSLQTLQKRDRTRPGIKEGCRKPLGDELIESLYNKVESNPIEGVLKLDTENQTIDQCSEIIRKNFE